MPNGDQGQSYVAVAGVTGVETSTRFHCWSFVREHLQNNLMPRSWVGDAERDSPKMGPSTPSIGPGSVPAYVPGMGKAT